MPVIVRRCFIAACDLCRTELSDPDCEDVLIFDDETSAEQAARSANWLVLPRTSAVRLLCPEADEPHRSAFAALMPPEPAIPIPGQLSLGGSEEAS